MRRGVIEARDTHDMLGSGGFDAKTGQFICGKRREEAPSQSAFTPGTPSARFAEGAQREWHLGGGEGDERVTH